MAESPDALSLAPGPGEVPALAQLLPLLLADQKRRWHEGECPLVEAYLQRFPAIAADTEAVLDLVYHEVICREARGDAPEVEEYQRRFPQLATQVKAQLELDRELGDRHRLADLGGATTAEPEALAAGSKEQPA